MMTPSSSENDRRVAGKEQEASRGASFANVDASLQNGQHLTASTSKSRSPSTSRSLGAKSERSSPRHPGNGNAETSMQNHFRSSPRPRPQGGSQQASASSGDDQRQDPLPSGAVMSSSLDRNESTPPLDAAERGQFNWSAASSPSSQLLSQATPRLPYDLSYPPLSPMGTDQTGHSIALKYGHSGAQNGKVTQNGLVGAGVRASGHAQHAGHGNERPKKTLPGEELETHILSESPEPRTMPWGLQTTLMEKARDLPRGKTRMGTLKRNAPRSLRTKQGVDQRLHTPQPIKLEDEGMSEQSSPALPTIEFEGSEPPATQSALAVDAQEQLNDGRQEQSAGEFHDSKMTIDPPGNESEAAANSEHSANGVHAGQPQASNESGRKRDLAEAQGDDDTPLKSDVLDSEAGDQSPHQTERGNADTSNVGELSLESVESGPSRRPREAHKRLKLMGGYYGKKAREAEAAASEGGAPAATPAPSASAEGTTSTRPSRAASEATLGEDDGAAHVTAAVSEDATVVTDGITDPSTPVKTAQQPSLAMGLRESAIKRQPTKLHTAGTRNDDEDNNNPFCDTCNGVGHFICCDGCPRSFHFACINPPLDIDELPSTFNDEDDQWFCNVCRSKNRPKGKKPKGVWGQLQQRVEDDNPTIFTLPHDIRNYFKGVATASDGSYVDSTMLKPLKVNKLGVVDERDPLRLKDKNGKLILCYRCGQSALPPSQDTGRKREIMAQSDVNTLSEINRTGWRKLIGCDFCTLYWHMDCLDPPLASMPSLTRKWMCPNHVEHVLRPERVPKNAANSLSVHDLPIPSEKTIGPGKHYRLRVVNDGHIDIIPDPMDTYFGSGSSASQDGEGHVASANAVTGSGGNENRGRGLEKGWEESDIPGAQARPPAKSINTLSTNAPHIRFKYRLPEKIIRVDFWAKAELERKRALDELTRLTRDRQRAPLDLLASIANAEQMPDSSIQAMQKTQDEAKSLSVQRARELVSKAFGSGAKFAQPFAPAHESSEPIADRSQVIAPEQEAVLISALRDTFVEGEFEREFLETEPLPPVRVPQKRPASSKQEDALDDGKDQPDAEMADVAAESKEAALPPNAAGAEALNTAQAQEQPLPNSLSVDPSELSQLRALKEIIDYRGADALLAFVLNGANSLHAISK